jgi:hypothetical protein
VLLREAGCKPLLYYWARSVFRFAAKLGEVPGEGHMGASPLMPDVLTSDLVLAGWGAQGDRRRAVELCWQRQQWRF